ncbi:MAG: GTP-binding protein, partial [Gammaproteobacteria bacterium]
MKIWKSVRDAWPNWSWPSANKPTLDAPGDGEAHLGLARDSLRDLLGDQRVPAAVRQALAEDYRQLGALLDKLEHGRIHIAVFGRVSVGKSALLNALLGDKRFSTSPLHGETKSADEARWEDCTVIDTGGVYLIDTPGINEIAGEARERLAVSVAARSDLVLFVVDGDITSSELNALRRVADGARPLLMVLNKADRYTRAERELLLATLRRRCAGLVKPEDIVLASAEPAEKTVILVDSEGQETETTRRPPPDVEALRERLWHILKAEGKTLAALNASLFAGRFSDRLAREIMALKRELAETLVRKYALGKGVAVALNPVPVLDLLAALGADVGMIIHLSRLYGFPISQTEAGGLLKVIISQTALLMGTVWGVNLAASALKGVSFGLSTVVTASAQGAVAWYGTYVVGRAAERYFAQGKSWGEGGPKRVIKDILDTL